MKPILEQTLRCIEVEADNFDQSFDLVDRLILEYGEQKLASRLYPEIDESIAWQIIADLFCILIWSTSDNGVQLTRETESWLMEGEDVRKLQIALNLDVYPFSEIGKMEAVLHSIALKHPILANKCNSMIEKRRLSSK